MEGASDSTSHDAGNAVQAAAAVFLSRLKNEFRTSQSAIDFAMEEVNQLTDLYLDFLKETLSKNCALYDGHLSLDTVFSVMDSTRGQSLFQGVHTLPLLDSFVAHKSTDSNPFGLIRIEFDFKIVFRRGIPHKVPTDFAYVTPFLKQLEQLLNCKDVLHCVDNPMPSEDDVYKSITDGYFYRYNFLVTKYGNKVLTFTIHVDDVQYADPCKSKTKKHKLRMFYWCLGNIYPELRSSLKAINLLGIVKYEVAVKYGNEAILKYFVKDLIILENGYVMIINGVQRIFYGFLQFVAADIPAAANLGGFKESHFALRPCRVCMCTRFELCDHFFEDERLVRRLDEHVKYVEQVVAKTVVTPTVSLVSVNLTEAESEIVEEDDLEQDLVQEEGPKFEDHQNPSVNYGVNSKSVLADAPWFDVTKCFPWDIMHVIFEGVAESLCRLILKEMCLPPKQDPAQQGPPMPKRRKRSQEQLTKKPKISLDYVNSIIQEKCDFGHLHTSKPSIIEKEHLKKKLKQSASQMIVLVHIMPVIAFNNISEEKLDLLGLLIKLIGFIMKFEYTEHNLEELGSSIVVFGETLVKVYPELKTLKLHSLKHLKNQIIFHGPLRQQACFRYEAMHREFTRLVDIINNMKNIEFSLACRHLAARNSDIMRGKDNGTFLYEGDILKKSDPIQLSTLPEKDLILETFPEYALKDGVCTVDSLKQHGRTWTTDVIVSLQSNDDPAFGIIVKIYFINGDVLFLYNNLQVDYISQFHAFEMRKRDHVLKCVKLSHLKEKFPILRFTVHFGTNNIRSFLVGGSSGDISA